MFSEAHDDQRLALGGGDRNDDYFVVDVVDVIAAVEDEIVFVFFFWSLSLAKTGDMVVLIVMINK